MISHTETNAETYINRHTVLFLGVFFLKKTAVVFSCIFSRVFLRGEKSNRNLRINKEQGNE